LTFALTLADPGPPLLLGLRRTLGYQMVLGATGDAPFPALASLGLIAILTAAAWRAGLRLWSGRDRATAGDRDDRPRPPASWRRAVATTIIAAGFAAFVLAALVGLGMVSRGSGTVGSGGATLVGMAADPTTARILVRSVALGLGVAVLAAVSGRAVARLEASAGPAAAGRFRRLAKASAPPPLAAGIVILALGRLLALASAAGWTGPSQAAAILSGDRAPLVAATLAAWLAVASARIGRGPLGPAESDVAPGPRLDAAALAGARRGPARRLARGASFGDGWRDLVVTLATAAVGVAPAVLILSSASVATVGPGVLLYRDRPDSGAAVAATLGLVAWSVALATAPIGAGRRRIASTSPSPRA
jgi:iron(III) transport system permease protein